MKINVKGMNVIDKYLSLDITKKLAALIVNSGRLPNITHTIEAPLKKFIMATHRILYRLPHNHPRIAEHAQPRAVFTPFLRRPRILYRTEDTLRVRHHNSETTIRRGQPGNTLR